MLESILNSLANFEWLRILPILIGGMAGYVYVVQEYRKKKDAAALIILQIIELQDKLVEFRTYITNSDINSKEIYESLPFMKINYWEKYKHMFVNKIDNRSYEVFDKFYQYVEMIQEQQNVAKNLIKDYFVQKQRQINDARIKCILEICDKVESTSLSQEQISDIANKTPTPPVDDIQLKQALSSILRQMQLQFRSTNYDYERFWKIYNPKNQWLINVTNQNALAMCIPVQIPDSINTVLKKYELINIESQEGYRELSNLAGITKTSKRIFTFFKWIL